MIDINQVQRDFDNGVMLCRETIRQVIELAAVKNTDEQKLEQEEGIDDVCHSPVCDDRCAFPRCMGPAPLIASDYEEVLADHRRLVRELDVLLNGEDGAAKQASLCDIVAQVAGAQRNRISIFARADDNTISSVLTDADILSIWEKCDTPSEENNWTTGPFVFARTILTHINASKDSSCG